MRRAPPSWAPRIRRDLAGGARRIERCWTEPLAGPPQPAGYGRPIRHPSAVPLFLAPPQGASQVLVGAADRGAARQRGNHCPTSVLHRRWQVLPLS